jgi:hypothetical protein
VADESKYRSRIAAASRSDALQAPDELEKSRET